MGLGGTAENPVFGLLQALPSGKAHAQSMGGRSGVASGMPLLQYMCGKTLPSDSDVTGGKGKGGPAAKSKVQNLKALHLPHAPGQSRSRQSNGVQGKANHAGHGERGIKSTRGAFKIPPWWQPTRKKGQILWTFVDKLQKSPGLAEGEKGPWKGPSSRGGKLQHRPQKGRGEPDQEFLG